MNDLVEVALALLHVAAFLNLLPTTKMTDFKTRQVAKNFQANEVSDGDGARVHRSIGSSHLYKFDPFLILDEFNVALPAGFPDHPHRGFQTVMYVFPTSKGGMRHEDFMSNQGELRAGDLQWMSAGRGIMHAEMPSSTEPACGLQLWINLPKDLKMIKPHYQEISRESVSHAFNEDKSVEAAVFAGEVFGYKGPIETEALVTYVHFLLKPGATVEYVIPASHNAFVYGVSGTGKCAGVDVRAHEAIVLEKEGDGVLLTAAKDDNLEVVVTTGEPLNEPVFQYGPFVMSSREDIQQTLWDFDLCTNGFEDAHGWRSEIAPRRRR